MSQGLFHHVFDSGGIKEHGSYGIVPTDIVVKTLRDIPGDPGHDELLMAGDVVTRDVIAGTIVSSSVAVQALRDARR